MTFAAVGMTALVGLLVGVFGGQWLAGREEGSAAVRSILSEPGSGSDRDGSDFFAGEASAAGTETADTGSGADTDTDGNSPAPGHSSLAASLDGGRFELAGVVPSVEVADDVRATVVTVYGTNIIDRLAVDPSVAPATWLPVAADVVASLPIISSGGIELTSETVTISGVAGSSAKHEQFVDALAQLLGPSIETFDEVVVQERPPPSLVIRKSGSHTIEVSGVVPTEELREQIEGSILGSYAGYNVETDLAVDADVEDTFTLHHLPEFAELFFGFPAWELSYVDEELESSSSGSAVFDVGSATVPPLGTEILDSVAARLAGMPSLRLAVEGHTDASGDAGRNQVLSEERALAVVDYLVTGHGIDPTRLTAQGVGETQPIDTNDTVAGRERNRRVDFRFVLSRSESDGR